jgi:hypothetical protein
MVRVVAVVMGYRGWQAFFLVVLLADVEAFLALWFVPRPVIGIMGGIRLTASERLLASTGSIATVLTFLGFLPLLIGAIAALVTSKPQWQPHHEEVKAPDASLLALAVLSLAGWVAVLPFTQPEQILRRQVELAFKERRVADALAIMSAHEPGDFPPHWDPPPPQGWAGQRRPVPSLADVYWEMSEAPPAAWVRAVYREKLRNYWPPRWGGADRDELRSIAHALLQFPEERAVIESLAEAHPNSSFPEVRKHMRQIETGQEAHSPDRKPD